MTPISVAPLVQLPTTSTITSVATVLVRHQPELLMRMVMANDETASALKGTFHPLCPQKPIDSVPAASGFTSVTLTDNACVPAVALSAAGVSDSDVPGASRVVSRVSTARAALIGCRPTPLAACAASTSTFRRTVALAVTHTLPADTRIAAVPTEVRPGLTLSVDATGGAMSHAWVTT
jgi:hypothetical protein